jgi:hypothetical protein
MKQALKDKWLAALRDGNYEQGTYFLRTADEKFCCLGVLCDIVDPSKWVYCSSVDAFEYGNINFPNEAFLCKVWLSTSAAKALAGTNDQGMSFEEIADVIEREISGVADLSHNDA